MLRPVFIVPLSLRTGYLHRREGHGFSRANSAPKFPPAESLKANSQKNQGRISPPLFTLSKTPANPKLLLIHFHAIANVHWLEREHDHARRRSRRDRQNHDLPNALARHVCYVNVRAIGSAQEVGI